MAAIATASESGAGTPCFRPLRSVERPASIALSVENAAPRRRGGPVVGFTHRGWRGSRRPLPLIVADEAVESGCKPSTAPHNCARHGRRSRTPYTPSECLERLRSLQAVVAAAEYDALLLVGGPDGRRHPGSAEAIHWLLDGRSGAPVFSVAGIGAEFDEVVVVVGAHDVRLYSPADAWTNKLRRLTAQWPRLAASVPPASLDDDAEAQEEHKIRSFIGMVAGVGAFGVPLATVAAGPASAVETWPLAQAFALQQFETLTGGGFFTQRHKVLPSLAELRGLVVQLDGRALTHLVKVEATRLAGCWADVEAALDARAGSRAFRLSEATLGEPALTYHEHGALARARLPGADADAAGSALSTARLLLGSRTALAPTAEPSSGGGAGRRRRPGGRAPPPHSRGRRAGGPLYAGRTLFLGSGISAPPRAPPSKPEPLLEPRRRARDARALARLAARTAVAAAKAAATNVEDHRAADVAALNGAYGALTTALHEVRPPPPRPPARLRPTAWRPMMRTLCPSTDFDEVTPQINSEKLLEAASRPPPPPKPRPRAAPFHHPHTAPQAFGQHGAGADEATLLATLGRRLEARAAAVSVSLPSGRRRRQGQRALGTPRTRRYARDDARRDGRRPRPRRRRAAAATRARDPQPRRRDRLGPGG